MAVVQKQYPMSKLLQILQNCKQIPKDDRLALRKFLKEGDESLSNILSDFNNKKLQIRLRKYLQKCKQNKKDGSRAPQIPNRQMTLADLNLKDKLKTNQTPKIQRQATKSLDKSSLNNLRASNQIKQIQQFREHLDEYRSLRSSLSSTQLTKPTSKTLANIANITKSPEESKVEKINVSNWASNHKYLIQSQNYLKEVHDKPRQNLFTSSDLLKWQPSSPKPDLLQLQTSTYFPSSTSSSINWSSTMQPPSSILPVTFTPTPFQQLQSLSSIFGKIRQTTSSNLQSNHAGIDNFSPNDLFGVNNLKNIDKESDYQKSVCEFKCVLIKHYAEDIFEHIAALHFPFTINDRSVFLPYRQLVLEVQKYLNTHGETVKVIKQNQMKIPVFEPFTNDYQSVTIKTLGQFLNKYCLHRNNQIKSIFIVLDALENGITLDRFRKINAWKGEQLVESFEKMVRKWGDMNTISYWQMYRIKNEKEFISFINIYSKA